MTKKDLIESIIHNMPEGLTELEKARYIYIELGKQRAFDTRYYYGSSSEKKRVYKQSLLERTKPEDLRNKRTILCTTLSELYKIALNEVGIKCQIVPYRCSYDDHVLPVVFLADEEKGTVKIRADLQQDMEFIQTGMSTAEFGTLSIYDKDFFRINQEQLKKIDQKIGYIKEDYRDAYIYKVHQQIRRKDANGTLQAILQNPIICKNTNFKGHVERRNYYRLILKLLAEQYLDRKIFMFSCYRERKDKDIDSVIKKPKREYTLCAYSHDKRHLKTYLYSEKEEKFVPVSLENLVKLQNEGLILGTTKKTKGVNQLKRFISQRGKDNIQDEER